MANSIDQLNYYDPLIQNRADKMSEVWIANLSAFIETLQGYLSSFGMFAPQLTTAQRDTIQSPVLGQLIYNTSTNELQVFQIKATVAAWRAITTVP